MGSVSALAMTDSFQEICQTDAVDCTGLLDFSTELSDYISKMPIDPQGGVETNGTGYSVAYIDGEIALVAENAETRFVGFGITETEYSDEYTPFYCGDEVTDSRDSQTYTTVEIGDQCWFAEDLRYDNGCTGNTWDNSAPYNACDTGGYDGLIYQWAAAMDGSTTAGAKGLCPDGWHIPTDQELTDLEDWLSSNGYNGVEGDALKDPAESWCNSVTCGGTGFLAVPAGYRSWTGSLSAVGDRHYVWSSSEDGADDAYHRRLRASYSDIYYSSTGKEYGSCIRCLKN